VRKRRGNILRILELADAFFPLVAHAPAGIDEQVSLQVGLFLVLLDVIAVGLAIGAPVDVTDFVAWVILPMFREFDAEALVRTLVHSGKKSFDECARYKC